MLAGLSLSRIFAGSGLGGKKKVSSALAAEKQEIIINIPR